jgi:hypothetical protein
MGLEPDKYVMWAVGAAARDEYKSRYGQLPPKELRPKTHEDRGSHCFAIYPEEMRSFIEDAFRSIKAEEARQQSFTWDDV